MPEGSKLRLRGDVWRTAAGLVLFSAVFLFVGWSIFWYVAHRAALAEMQSWLDWEARQGRLWKCETLQSGGYPTAIEIDCDRPSLRATVEGRALQANVVRAFIRAPLYTPKLVVIDLTGPAVLSTADGASSAAAKWGALQISSRGLPDRLDRLSLVGEGVEIESRVNGQAATTIKAAALQAHLRRASGAVGSPYNIASSIAGVEFAPLNDMTGSDMPAVLAFIGSVTQVDRALVGSLPEKLEAWRAAGGRVTVNLLSLQKGALAVQADGALALSQSRRIDGKLDVRYQNVGDALANAATRLGIVRPGSLAGVLAGSLLGASAKDGATAVAFENGALSIGPLKDVIVLPPLY